MKKLLTLFCGLFLCLHLWAQLTIEPTSIEVTTTTNQDAVLRTKTPHADFGWYSNGALNHYRLYDFNAGADRVSIISNGRFGIGTTSPVGRFHVYNNDPAGSGGVANALIGYFERDLGGAKTQFGIYGYPNSTSVTTSYIRGSTMLYASSSTPTLQIAAANTNGVIRFHTSGWTSATSERMSITNSGVNIQGKLGIGTENPEAKQHIYNDGPAGGESGTNGANISLFERILNGKSTKFSILGYPDDPLIGFPYVRGSTMLYGDSATPIIQIAASNADGKIRFHTGGWASATSERMSISNSGVNIQGKLGIGTGNPEAKQHIYNDGPAGGEFGTNGANISLFERILNGKSTKFSILGYPDDSLIGFPYVRGTTMLYADSNTPIIQIAASNADGKIRFHTGGWASATSERMSITSNEVKINTKVVVEGADVAEKFNINSLNAKAGMLVSIDPDNAGELTISQQAYDKKIAGVISGANGVQAGMMLAQKGTLADGDTPVAITGRVYCYADASNVPIQIGDFLTTSAIPGFAMKAVDFDKARGAIIGKAMTNLDGGQGMVLILITQQ